MNLLKNEVCKGERKTKKRLLMILCGSLVIVLSGCSNTKESQNNNTSTITEESGYENDTNTMTVIIEKSDMESKTDSVTTEANQNDQDTEQEEQTNNSSYYGTWEVQDYQAAGVSALSTEECEAFKEYMITYQADAVFQNGNNMNLTEVEYQHETYTEETLVQDYRANLGEWWNGIEEVRSVNITSTDNFFGSHFFVADNNTIWIYYEGVFFLAKKV